ncbi:alpha/beta hydrolase family protein [Chloroflexota bacterium]
MNLYDYKPAGSSFDLSLRETDGSGLHYRVTFPAAPSECYGSDSLARGEYIRPRNGGNGTLAILIHGWGDRSVVPCRLLAKDLVKRGTACFILYMVFHSSRMPEAMKKKGHHLADEEWFEGYRLSVIDVRQIVGWAAARDEINDTRIAVIGLSLGGFVSAISMGVEKRIGAGVFLLTGGNYENPVWAKKRHENHNEAELRETQDQYIRYLARVEEKGFKKVVPAKKSYLTDPVSYGSYLQERPVLMYNARWDIIVPREAAIDLWQACGEPEIRWFPTGHASLWLLYPLIRNGITGFLKSAFRQ